jgi:serine/threonine protein kinase
VTGVAAEVGSTANNYQILARLATGGMAEIFLARGVSGTGVERYVVLKRILRDRANDVQLVTMFLDEARLAAQLQHPNVAQVYDIGKLGDSYFFTMEYVHGETVRALLHRARSLRREIPNNVILTVVAGAASGLHHAHERLGHDGRPLGIVHRDVSPSNLMVSYEGGVKVVDFGVAKAENRVQETRSGTVKGKIAYLSPEQCRGAPIDRRSDLFSLGIVFWEMLTVERLYKRASDFDNMTAIVTEDPVPPSARRPGISPELDRIVMKLLSKDPNARYQTGDELVDALEEASPRLGAMISTSSVGRLVRDMFGQRPEPWLEMDATVEMPQSEGSGVQRPEGVTVTSEPIPKELGLAQAQSMDALLSNVRDLNRAPSDSMAPKLGGAPSAMMTTPAMPAQRPDRELTMRASAPPPGHAPGYAPPGFPPQRGHHGSGPQATIMGSAVPPTPHLGPASGPVAENFPPAGSSSGEHAYPNVGTSGVHHFQGAGSTSGAHSYPTGSQLSYPMQVTEKPKKQRGWPLFAIVAGAAVIGSLTVWLVMRGGSGGSTPPADAASVVAVADADVVELPPTKAVDAAVVAVDAAAVVDAAAIEDAAVAVKPDAATVARDPLEVAMQEKRYTDVIAMCSRTMATEQAGACTLAACRTSQDAKAQRWFPKISTPAARRTIQQSCREAGVDVIPKAIVRPPQKVDAGVDPCAINPMACPR